MLVQSGQVVAASRTEARVVCDSLADCRRCAAGSGCGGAYLGRLLGDPVRRVRIGLDGRRVSAGDRVCITLDESVLLRGALLVYLVPLCGLLAGVLLGHLAAGESGALAGAATGLLTGCGAARLSAGRLLRNLHRAARLK